MVLSTARHNRVESISDMAQALIIYRARPFRPTASGGAQGPYLGCKYAHAHAVVFQNRQNILKREDRV